MTGRKNNELADLEPARPVSKKEDNTKKYKEEIEQLKKRIKELEEENERLKKENEKLREDNTLLKQIHNKIFHDIHLFMKVAKPPVILREPADFYCLSYRIENVLQNKLYILNQTEVICGGWNANNNSNSK